MILRAEPFPWDQIPRLTNTEVRHLRCVTRTLAAADAGTARAILDKLLGASVSLRTIELAHPRQPSPHAITLELGGDARMVCEIPGALASWIVERSLGGDSAFSTLEAGLSTRDETSLGALAYVAARLLATVPSPIRLEGVEPTSQPLRANLSRSTATCIALRIEVDSADVDVHLWIWTGWDASRTGPLDLELVRWLLDERITLSAQLMHGCRLTVGAAAALRIDDVVTAHAPSVTGHRHRYQGEVQVITPGLPGQRWLASARDDRFELQQLQPTEDRPMTTGKTEPQHASIERALSAVADAPLELSVELARFTLPLAEVAALTKGDVLMSGRPIGEHVTLRAGSRAIATGELVNVDGTIGVRIVSLAGA